MIPVSSVSLLQPLYKLKQGMEEIQPVTQTLFGRPEA